MKHIGLAKPLQYKNTRTFHTATDIHNTPENCMIACYTSHVSQQINLLFPPSTTRRYDMDFARHTQTHTNTDTHQHRHTNMIPPLSTYTLCYMRHTQTHTNTDTHQHTNTDTQTWYHHWAHTHCVTCHPHVYMYMYMWLVQMNMYVHATHTWYMSSILTVPSTFTMCKWFGLIT